MNKQLLTVHFQASPNRYPLDPQTRMAYQTKTLCRSLGVLVKSITYSHFLVTDDVPRVTCKVCLKKLGKSGQ